MQTPMTHGMGDDLRTDWPALIQRLERYYRHLDIGLEVGRSERWVGMLKSGVIDEPPHSIGEMLKAMDRDLMRRLAAQDGSIPRSLLACPT